MKEKKAKMLLEDVKSTYNKIAEEFSITRRFPGREFSFFKKYIKDGSTIIDLGCGNGRLVPFLKTLFKNGKKISINYLGIDNNENFIRIAKKIYPKEKFIQGDHLEIPSENKSADMIFSIRSFHHIPSKELRVKSLHEINRVLKDGGVLIITVWNLWQIKYWKELLLAIFYSIISIGECEYNDTFINWGKKEKRYYHAFIRSEITKLIKNNGFKILENHSKYHDFIIIAQKKSKLPIQNDQ